MLLLFIVSDFYDNPKWLLHLTEDYKRRTNIMVQALNAALLHYDADIRKRNAKGQKPNGYV